MRNRPHVHVFGPQVHIHALIRLKIVLCSLSVFITLTTEASFYEKQGARWFFGPRARSDHSPILQTEKARPDANLCKF
jgi:hypothetical protein